MRLLIAIFLTAFSLKVSAGEYGFLRVAVVSVNPAHTTVISLRLNGSSVLQFSHSSAGAMIVDISSSMLAKSKSTPMSSDYSSLQEGCKFTFQVSYSFDQQNWISIGTFEAPTNAVNASIPIGICEGSVCSGDQGIQSKIKKLEEERWEKAGDEIRKWLEVVFANQKKETEAIRARLASENKAPAPNPVIVVDTQDVENNIEVLQHQDVKEITDVADVGPMDVTIDTVISEAIDAGTVNGLIEKNAREADFLQWCQASDKATQYMCDRYGGLGFIGAAAEAIAIGMASDPLSASADLQARILDPEVAARLQTAAEQRAEMQIRIQKVLEAKRSEAMWAKIKTASRVGVALTPLNDAVDLCEALTGKAMCLPSGENLSGSERFMATLGMIAGNRVWWEAVSKEARIERLAEFFEGVSESELHAMNVDFKDVTVRNATDVNALLSDLGYTNPPYKLDSKILEFTTQEDLPHTFVRVTYHEQGQVARWIIPRASIEGLSPVEIKNKLELLNVPSLIVDIDIPKGTPMRAGLIHYANGASQDLPKAMQYELVWEELEKNGVDYRSFYKNLRELK